MPSMKRHVRTTENKHGRQMMAPAVAEFLELSFLLNMLLLYVRME